MLSLPEQPRADLRNVHVTENGDPVSESTLVAGEQGRRSETFGVVLVLDTSYSMAGKPLAAALAAAQSVRRRAQPERGSSA